MVENSEGAEYVQDQSSTSSGGEINAGGNSGSELSDGEGGISQLERVESLSWRG